MLVLDNVFYYHRYKFCILIIAIFRISVCLFIGLCHVVTFSLNIGTGESYLGTDVTNLHFIFLHIYLHWDSIKFTKEDVKNIISLGKRCMLISLLVIQRVFKINLLLCILMCLIRLHLSLLHS